MMSELKITLSLSEFVMPFSTNAQIWLPDCSHWPAVKENSRARLFRNRR